LSWHIAHRPPHAAQDMLPVAWIPPDLLAVPEGGIEDAALALASHPGNGIILVFPLPLGGIDGSVVDTQDDMLIVPRPGAKLIDLVRNFRIFGKRHYADKFWILDLQAHLLEPWVAVEVAADHRAVVSPLVECVGSGMHSHEAVAGPQPL